MVFNDPNSTHNPSTGAVAPASWGDVVRDDLIAVYGPPACRLHLTANQNTTTGTLTTVLFNNAGGEDIDTHSLHSPTSNPSRITVPTGWDGRWMIGATVDWDPAATSGTRRFAEIVNQTGARLVGSNMPVTGSGYATQNLSTMASAVAGEYWELIAFQDSAGNLSVLSDGFAGTIFWAHFIGSGAG